MLGPAPAQMLVIQLIRQEVYKLCHFQCAPEHSVMVTHLILGVIFLAVFATTVANAGTLHTSMQKSVTSCIFLKRFTYRNHENLFADIKVVCAKDSVKITWRVSPELVPYAARLFLGNCMPSRLDVLPTGEGDAQFNYQFTDCKFKRMVI